MEDYIEVFEYDNSEPEDAWWNEQSEYEWEEPEEEPEDETAPESPVLSEILETLSGTQNYGTMGDYYNMILGCYVFPGYEVYEYFIDIETSGHEWTETADGHWVPVLYLDRYEAYTADEGEEELPEDDRQEGYQLTEYDLQSMEVMESIRGTLSVIKENNTVYFNSMQEYQEETLALQEKETAFMEGILYSCITLNIITSITAGAFVAHTFFERMRAG